MDADSQTLERSLLALEGRVKALEETIATLRDTQAIEERITERVAAQVPQVSVASVVEALATQPLPPAVQSLVTVPASPSTLKQVARSSWLVVEMIQEFMAIGRMLVDPRYHTAWVTRFLLIVILLAILLSGLWVPLSSIDFIGPLLIKLVNFVLAGVLFVALFCETRRYKEWRLTQPPR